MTATAASPGGSSRPSGWPHPPMPSFRLGPGPTPPPVPTLVRSSQSVPIATSTIASLGDISNESPRGHYQRVTTLRPIALDSGRQLRKEPAELPENCVQLLSPERTDPLETSVE